MAAQRVGHHPHCFDQMRRAGRIQHHAARTGQRDRGGQQFALQLGQRRHIGRLTAPTGLRPAAQGTQPGAGHIDQHPVETRLETGLPPVDPHHVNVQPAGVLGDQVRATRRRLDRGDPGTAVGAQGGQQRGLAARAGAQVQPAPGVGRRPAPVSSRGPPVGCPRPAPAPGRRAPAASCPGSPPGRYTAYGE